MTASAFFAVFPRYPDFMENASFIAIGFAMVLMILVVLAIITSLVGRLFVEPAGEKAKKVATPAQQQSSVPAPAPVAADEEDFESSRLPFLIAAAVDFALKGMPHRIVTVRTSGENWAREGRRDIQGSHRLR